MKINFGISGYDSRDSNRIIEIPESGRLDNLTMKHYSVCKPRKVNFKPEKTERYFPAVIFDFLDKLNEDESIILLWIEERGEWVAVHYQE